jgi:hypothetical protein
MTSQKRMADHELNANSIEVVEVRLFSFLGLPCTVPMTGNSNVASVTGGSPLHDYDYDRQRNFTRLDCVQSMVRKQVQRASVHEHELHVNR